MKNASTTLAAALFTVFAASAALPAHSADNSGAPLTRAQVRAELAQAYADGTLGRPEFVDYSAYASRNIRTDARAEVSRPETGLVRQHAAQSEFVDHHAQRDGRSRAEVRAELEQAYAAGELNHQPEYVEHVRLASTRSRNEVRQEAVQIVKGLNGENVRAVRSSSER
jgi:hypothetical protein